MSLSLSQLVDLVDITNGIASNQLSNQSSCTFSNSITHPLYDKYGSSLNPCFVGSISFVFNAIFGIFAFIQLLTFLFNNKVGPYNLKYGFGYPFSLRSVGIYQLIKLNSIALQIILNIILFAFLSTNKQIITLSVALTIILNLIIIFPLHVIEPTRSPNASASLLLYWTLNIVFYIMVLISDSFSSHKIYLPIDGDVSSVYAIEIVLLINSALILWFELVLYKPSKELKEYFELNDWKINSIRNIYNELSFYWLNGLIKKVYDTNDLESKDLPPLPLELDSESNYQVLQSRWNIAESKAKSELKLKLSKITDPTDADKIPKVSLLLIIIGIFWKQFIIIFLFDVIAMIFGFSQAFLLQAFILFFTDTATSDNDDHRQPAIVGFSIAFTMFVFSLANSVCVNRYFLINTSVANQIKGALTTMIYKKTLRLSPESRKVKNTGEIVNNLTLDASMVSSVPHLIDILSAPIRLVLTLASLVKIIGVSTFAGLLGAFILVPFSLIVNSKVYPLILERMKVKDERTKLTNEILSSIKSIKLYSWESPMLKRLFYIRNEKELQLGKSIGILISFLVFLWSTVPFFITCTTLITFSYISKVALVPAIVFPALNLFSMLAEPIMMLPNVLNMYFTISVSLGRLTELFLLDEKELETGFVEHSFKPAKKNEDSVIITDATFVWDKSKYETELLEETEGQSEDNVALSGINFSAKKGQLTCIVGKVGSGKTTSLRGILEEVSLAKKDTTSIKINGSIAYCPQSPWIMNSTIKENILFGFKFDKRFYEETVSVCQLLADFDILPDGDRTVVGEKGISLSGGQKARIALARSVYSRADIYLLDDVLSAVDAHVGKKITDLVLGPQGILASKTIILATNSVPTLRFAHEIVLLRDKTISERGSFKESMDNNGDLAALILEFGKHVEEDNVEAEEPIEDPAKVITSEDTEVTEYQPESNADVVQENLLERIETRSTLGRASLVSFEHEYDEEEDGVVRRTGHTVEEGAKGQVKLSVYLEYLKNCNFPFLLLYLVLSMVEVGLGIWGWWVLQIWTDKNLEAGKSVDTVFYLSLYAISGVLSCIAILVAFIVVWTVCVFTASKYFHDSMAKSVLRSPMSFFETTPVGRILNRFSDDLGTIDQELIWTFISFFMVVLGAIGKLVVIVLVLPGMWVLLLILFVFYNNIRQQFIPAQRELKRLSSANKSPVIAHLQESLNGIETIKAFGQVDRFSYKNELNVNTLANSNFTNSVCGKWLSTRLQIISNAIIFGSSLTILSTLGTSYQFSPGLVGFAMANGLGLTSMLSSIISMWASIETMTVSLERIIEYCYLKSEAAEVIEDNRPPLSWPAEGSISFKSYSTKYRENLDPVLKNLSLDIKPGEKVGIVGRTGAGKTTVAMSVFRIIEPTEGYIEIDGINTSSIGLSDLRQHLNIIPQDPQIVEGTVRQNLDPLDRHTDDELWTVLEHSHLKEHVETMKTKKNQKKEDEKEKDANPDEEDDSQYDFGLSAKVFEGGSNLSSGQKQLLSLARALLIKSKILILDEATAAVDVQTDKIIQETIRTEFNDRTILTIAHRINTILESDRILVLDHGKVKEFDTPENLLNDETSEFYSLCKESGNLKKDST
ncbi:hypothetical protein DFJ63DRAFT_25619 [Scheffersomyces coipomensis]|uniref:uncharacterized protein n=1 Tax=Scheffersomyces coipomensis TaxID=1788519 RepID=UPI00315DA919